MRFLRRSIVADWRSLALGAALLASATASVRSAEITSEAVGTDEEAFTLILIEGELERGDEQKFANLALTTDNAVVLFSGPGEDLIAGIEIGNAIRLKGFATLVPRGFQCASACALAWLAGRPRLMEADSSVGFHAAFRIGEGVNGPDAVANALVGAYVNQLGLPLSAVVYLTEALPDEMRWLKFDDAARIGIHVERFELDDTEEHSSSGKRERANRLVTEPPPVEPQDTQTASLSEHGVWIQIFSRQDSEEAIRLAENYQDRLERDASVFLYENGWYGVVLGPYPLELGDAVRARLLEASSIPADSLITKGDKFLRLVWGRGAGDAFTASDREAKAIEGAERYFRSSSMVNTDALDFMRRVYAPELLYFGRWATRSEVLRDKAEFVIRWPERLYEIQPDSTRATCARLGACTVEGVVEWSAYSSERDTTSLGAASFRLVFSTLDPLTIVLDESTVLSRQIVSGRKTGGPTETARVETFAVGDIAANDALNMRTGPGTAFPIVTVMPPGSRDVSVSLCVTVVGFAVKWCQVDWHEHQGWASACCLFGELTGQRPD